MKIDLNKDFETQFKNEAWRGFTGRELAYGICGMAAMFAAAGLIWWRTNLPINLCIYFGIPFLIVICLAGLIQYQGKTVVALIREVRYFFRTRKLCCQAEERRETDERIFSLKSSERRR